MLPRTCTLRYGVFAVAETMMSHPSIRKEKIISGTAAIAECDSKNVMSVRNRLLKQYIAENIFRTTDDGPRPDEKTSHEKNSDEKNSDEKIRTKKVRTKKIRTKKFGRKNSDENKWGARHGGKARPLRRQGTGNGVSWGAKPPRLPRGARHRHGGASPPKARHG